MYTAFVGVNALYTVVNTFDESILSIFPLKYSSTYDCSSSTINGLFNSNCLDALWLLNISVVLLLPSQLPPNMISFNQSKVISIPDCATRLKFTFFLHCILSNSRAASVKSF